jgi:hypothetical protein
MLTAHCKEKKSQKSLNVSVQEAAIVRVFRREWKRIFLINCKECSRRQEEVHFLEWSTGGGRFGRGRGRGRGGGVRVKPCKQSLSCTCTANGIRQVMRDKKKTFYRQIKIEKDENKGFFLK